MSELMHHLQDHSYFTLWDFGPYAFDMTKHTVVLMIAAGLVMVLLAWIGSRFRSRKSLIPRGILMNSLEAFVEKIRDGMVYKMMGEETGKRYLNFILTIFFFIFTCNILGLVPTIQMPFFDFPLYPSATATGNLNINLALAILVFVVGMIDGIREHGPFGYIANYAHGAPIYTWPVIIPLEVFGMLIKHAVLAIRLLANMIAGHAVLFGILLMSVQFVEQLQSPTFAFLAAAGPVVLGILIFCIEILVAIIQAYVFTVLSVIFLDMQVSHH